MNASSSFILSLPSCLPMCHEGMQGVRAAPALYDLWLGLLGGCLWPTKRQHSLDRQDEAGVRLFWPLFVGDSPRNHGLESVSWSRSIWGYKFRSESVPLHDTNSESNSMDGGHHHPLTHFLCVAVRNISNLPKWLTGQKSTENRYVKQYMLAGSLG